MSDAFALIARARLQFLSEEIEEQLTARQAHGHRVLQTLLHMARNDATEAMVALCEADPDNTRDIRRLQNQIALFNDHVRFLRQIIREGEEAVFDVPDAKRAEFEELIFQPAGEASVEQIAELERLGIIRSEDVD